MRKEEKEEDGEEKEEEDEEESKSKRRGARQSELGASYKRGREIATEEDRGGSGKGGILPFLSPSLSLSFSFFS